MDLSGENHDRLASSKRILPMVWAVSEVPHDKTTEEISNVEKIWKVLWPRGKMNEEELFNSPIEARFDVRRFQ